MPKTAEAQGSRKKPKSPNNGTAKAKKAAKSDINMADVDMLLNPNAKLTKEQKERRKPLISSMGMRCLSRSTTRMRVLMNCMPPSR